MDPYTHPIMSAALHAIKQYATGENEHLAMRIWDDVRRAMLQAHERDVPIEHVFEGGRRCGRRFTWIHENPDGTRREARVGQPMRHVKTGGRYVLTAFVIRESDMQQGFDYFSMRTGETFWRPIQELFDGRFEFITMEELCSTS